MLIPVIGNQISYQVRTGLMPRRMPRMNIYLVIHHEIGEPMGEAHCVHAMVFNTTRTLAKALKIIKTGYVARYSWWEIQSQELDSDERPEHIGFFGPRGGKLAKAPYEKCIALYEKDELIMKWRRANERDQPDPS
jgi:hypothetical protein